jgi:rhamnosyltransferase
MSNHLSKGLNNSPVVIAVLVTFFPDIGILTQSLQALSNQCRSIILVDNTPAQESMLSAPIPETSKQKVISLGDNFGIAYAQNIGIEAAILAGADYVLLMDQDSIPEKTMVKKLLTAFENPINTKSNVIAAGPSYIDPRSKIRSFFMVSKLGIPFRYKPAKHEKPLYAVKTTFLISSGSLISIAKLKLVGGNRSNYFIDHVDTEWCLRAISKGFTLVGLHSATMEHALGDKVKRIWFFYLRAVAYHSPLRDYYMFRNTILMLRDTKIPALWATFLILRLLQFAGYFLLFANERALRLKCMYTGLIHGLKGAGGQLDIATWNCTKIPKTSLDPVS